MSSATTGSFFRWPRRRWKRWLGPRCRRRWRASPTTDWPNWSAKYPDRFIGFVASLPLNNPDESLKEMDQAVNASGRAGDPNLYQR